MQRNYRVLEAVANQVLALAHTPKVGSSNQASPSGSVGVAVGSASEGISFGAMRADIYRYVPAWLQTTISSLGSQHLSNSCIFTRSPSSMEVLAGYRPIAERQKRGVTLLLTSLLLRSLEGTGGAWLMWGPISKEQEDEVERVRSVLSEIECECKNLVTQKNLFESGLLQGMADIIKGSTKVAMDLDDAEMQRRLRESRAKKAEKGVPGRRLASVLEMTMKGWLPMCWERRERWRKLTRVLSKLPLGMKDVYAEEVEKVDFSTLRQQKKEVNLAMHRQEVPLVNVFLEGVKSDPEVLARTQVSSYADRAQKTFLTHVYKAALAREVEELKRSKAEEIAAIQAKVEQKKAEDVAAARAEAVELFRSSEELRSCIMGRLVYEQLCWEERLARFNPSVEINFDTSCEPLSPSPTAKATPEPEPTTTDAPSTEF
ncbi:unnamed protein product [Prunus armeniaca]